MSDLSYEATASLVQLVTAARQIAAALEQQNELMARQNQLMEIIAEQMPARDQDGAIWVRSNG